MKPHGANARYASGCRCLLCRVGRANYEAERRRVRALGNFDPVTAAKRVRRHLKKLARLGVGLRAVADVTGINRVSLYRIRSGRRLCIFARTEEAVLAVDAGCVADGALVPAGPLWRRIRQLREMHFTQRQLLERLGYRTGAMQFGRTRVTARNALKVERLYRGYQ